KDVFMALNSSYVEFVNPYRFTFDVNEELETIADHLEECKNALGGDYDWTDVQCEFTVLATLIRVHGLLEGIDGLLDIGEFNNVAHSIAEMQQDFMTLRTISDEEKCPQAILELVTDEYLNKKATLVHTLNEIYGSAIIISSKGQISELTVAKHVPCTNMRNYCDNPVVLSDMWMAMETTGVLDHYLGILSDRLVNHFVVPMVRNPNVELLLGKTKFHSSLKFAAKRLKAQQQQQRQDPVTVLQNVLVLSRFVKETILQSSPICSEALSEIWCPALISSILDEFLFRTVPEGSPALIEEHCNQILDFEREMKDLGLIPPHRTDFTTFVRNIERVKSQKRRSKLLTLAREVLQSEDQNTAEVTEATERGGFSILHGKNGGKDDGSAPEKPKMTKEGLEVGPTACLLPTCHISVQAQTIVEMVYQSLNDPEISDQLRVEESFYCARDLFDLYRGVVTAQHGNSIENQPARTVVFYNDCHYMVYHLLTLGHQYRTRLPQPLNSLATFIDQIPCFRKAGEMYFRNQMRKQRDLLKQTIEEAGGFDNLNDDERFETVETAVRKAVTQLINLGKTWKPLLPSETYFRAIGMLADSLLELVMNEVKKVPAASRKRVAPGGMVGVAGSDADSVVTSYQLRYILSLFDRLQTLFTSSSASTARTGKGNVQIPISKHISNWDSFRSLLVK
ncbi:Centromere/kinetochore protein zw10, partial [Quaeritorhiza haematococci]